jgi:hypothetical protein
LQPQTRFESLENATGLFSFLFPEQQMILLMIVTCKIKLKKTDKEIHVAMMFHPIYIDSRWYLETCAADSFIQKAKDLSRPNFSRQPF